MVLSSGKAASDLLPIVPLIATKHENVKEGCIDKCRTVENLCFEGSRCINEYNDYRCDCFGTPYEEQLCDVYSEIILIYILIARFVIPKILRKYIIIIIIFVNFKLTRSIDLLFDSNFH